MVQSNYRLKSSSAKKLRQKGLSMATQVAENVQEVAGGYAPLLPFNESYFRSPGNLQKSQEAYRIRRDLVVAANAKPRLAVLAVTGKPGFPLPADRHLFPMAWLRMWQLLPMNRAFAQKHRDIPEGLEGDPEFQLLEHRYHLQQFKCRTKDGDPIFGDPTGLVGRPKDASQFPRTAIPTWVFQKPKPEGQNWLTAPMGGRLTLKEDDLFVNILINGSVAFRFWKDTAYEACPDFTNINKVTVRVSAKERVFALREPVPYLAAIFQNGKHLQGRIDPDIIQTEDVHTQEVVMAMFKTWEANSPRSLEEPYYVFMRRMIELPSKDLLSGWTPPRAFVRDRHVVSELRRNGVNPEKEPEVYRHLFEHDFIVPPGQSGYEGHGVLVDWRYVDEKTRSAATGRDWARFNHMRHLVDSGAGNGYFAVINHTGEEGREVHDSYFEFQNGIHYDYTPILHRPLSRPESHERQPGQTKDKRHVKHLRSGKSGFRKKKQLISQ